MCLSKLFERKYNISLNIVNLLLDRCTNFDFRDNSLVHLACECNNYNMLKLGLSKVKTINRKNDDIPALFKYI